MSKNRLNSPGQRIRAIICDDEPLARDCVRLALAADPHIDVVHECEDGDSAVAEITRLRPDLLFLDVQMPGLDGFDVLSAIPPDERPVVVFVTAFDRHALRAFEMHALDYLLKPFTDERFHAAVSHAKEQLRIHARDLPDRIDQLLHQRLQELGGAATHRLTRFVVRHDERLSMIRVQDVDWFASDGNYVTLNVGDRTYRVRTSLRALGARLDARRFARIHKSMIVNLERIRELQPWFGGDYVATLADGRKLRVSRNYAPDLLKPMQ